MSQCRHLLLLLLLLLPLGLLLLLLLLTKLPSLVPLFPSPCPPHLNPRPRSDGLGASGALKHMARLLLVLLLLLE